MFFYFFNIWYHYFLIDFYLKKDKSRDDEPSEITQLVWSHDFNQVLKERREKRLLEIEERKKQEDEDEEEEDVAGKEGSNEFLENEDHTY